MCVWTAVPGLPVLKVPHPKSSVHRAMHARQRPKGMMRMGMWRGQRRPGDNTVQWEENTAICDDDRDTFLYTHPSRDRSSRPSQSQAAFLSYKDFAKGDVVMHYGLKPLGEAECENLHESEKMFTHAHGGQMLLHAEPERYVHHAEQPNTYQDFSRKADSALRDITKGEMITTNARMDDEVE